MEGTETEADGYRWSQTEEEVELKFAVASGTKAKYVKVSFARRSVKVTVAGQTLIRGTPGGDVDVEGCTYTLQDAAISSERELCVTLGKRAAGENWGYAVMSEG